MRNCKGKIELRGGLVGTRSERGCVVLGQPQQDGKHWRFQQNRSLGFLKLLRLVIDTAALQGGVFCTSRPAGVRSNLAELWNVSRRLIGKLASAMDVFSGFNGTSGK